MCLLCLSYKHQLTNRQKAVKAIAKQCDLLMVIGAPNSSNSKRLVEGAKDAGWSHSILVHRAADINLNDLDGIQTLGITAGASAPEVLVREVIETLSKYFNITLSEYTETEEKVSFPLPASLRE